MLDNDPLVDRSDHRLPRMKPRRQHHEAGVSLDWQACILLAGNDLQQRLEPGVRRNSSLVAASTRWTSFSILFSKSQHSASIFHVRLFVSLRARSAKSQHIAARPRQSA
jgi:hypothetical protein